MGLAQLGAKADVQHGEALLQSPDIVQRIQQVLAEASGLSHADFQVVGDGEAGKPQRHSPFPQAIGTAGNAVKGTFGMQMGIHHHLIPP